MFEFLKIFNIVFVIITFSGCSFFSPDRSCKNVITVGTNAGFVPYEFVDETGEIVGFDVDLSKLIAKEMNKELVIKNMPFDALIISLKQGKIDMILAGLSITKKKQKEIAMIHYLGDGEKEYPLVFWEKIPDGINSIYDLKKFSNKTIAVQAGNIQEKFISQFNFIDVRRLGDISDLIMDIKYGKSIACIIETLVVDDLQKKIPELKVLPVPLDDKYKDYGHGIGIKKENTGLIKLTTAIVDKLKVNGEMDLIVQKWFGK